MQVKQTKVEYEKYRKTENEKYISDFDREMKKLGNKVIR